MRSSDLIEILNSEEEVGALRQAIAVAMPAFRSGSTKRGGSAPIVVEAVGQVFTVDQTHVLKICAEYLSGRLHELELAYLATAFELCPDFRMASEGVEEAVSFLADPVANGPLSRDGIEAVIALGGHPKPAMRGQLKTGHRRS